MARLLPLLLCAARALAENRSRGCAAPQGAVGELVQENITVPDFEQTRREFWVQAPPGGAPAPLLLVFHGQWGNAKDTAKQHFFNSIEPGLMTVYPQGLDDWSEGQDQGTGWNVGSAGGIGNETCLPQGVGNMGACYDSCKRLELCGRCNWSTCHNDVLFVRLLIAAVAEKYCVDLDRVYLHGMSNGGMFVNHLVRELPNVFAGLVPWFGSPMLGFLLGREMQLVRQQSSIAKVALLAVHDRSDRVIPLAGGVSENGWIYESEENVRGSWAALHGCAEQQEVVSTPFDGGPFNLRCMQHPGCSSGRQVMGCYYDGNHGEWPNITVGDKLSLWFLLRFSRGGTAAEVLV